ncbi:hypothetical protein HMPREF1207_04103 [Paenibacillus sp. HGH0039]|nr:hypothetical protein HMPREF1207_04103 [Paenibacillus sp. HGH0039]
MKRKVSGSKESFRRITDRHAVKRNFLDQTEK